MIIFPIVEVDGRVPPPRLEACQSGHVTGRRVPGPKGTLPTFGLEWRREKCQGGPHFALGGCPNSVLNDEANRRFVVISGFPVANILPL